MKNNYTANGLKQLDALAEKVFLILIQEDFRKCGGSNYPKVFPDYADTAYRLADELLNKREIYRKNNAGKANENRN